MQPRSRWKAINGVLLLDKPVGLSSNDALQKARRLFQAAKAGHTGTLDPLASGLLPVCFGEATRFAGLMLDADKEYIAQVRLGIRTSTGDAEGEVISERTVTVGESAIRQAVAAHVGEIDQLPPMHSALKKDGRPLYEYARAGETVERAVRRVRIVSIDLSAVLPPDFTMRVRCSKGTYIRTLAEDIGEMLGCGAHLTGLRRTRTGLLDLDDAVTLERIGELDEVGRMALLQPADVLVRNMPSCRLDAADARRLINGQPVSIDGVTFDDTVEKDVPVRAYAGPVFLGLVTVRGKVLRVHRLMPQDSAKNPEST